MSESTQEIQCSKHGSSKSTFVCTHLVNGKGLGFNYGYEPDEPDALYPDAWCDACEAVWEEEGEWNDWSQAHADIKMLCSGCYQDLRRSNWIEDQELWQSLVEKSCEYLNEKQTSFLEVYKIDEHERWDWDQETGKLIFSHAGTPQVEADIAFSGSISTDSDTWLWAWANKSLMEAVKSDARQVRELGEQHAYHDLASALWPATAEDGWTMTAIMAKTLNAIGAYRTPNEHGFMYMVVKSARWV